MRATIIIALVLAGCTFPTKPGDPLACNGDPLPMTAPPTISIHASVRDGISGKPVSSTITETIDNASDTGDTDANGDYDTQLMTLGLPHAALLHSVPDDMRYVDTYEYPALPIANDQAITIFHFQSSSFVDPRSQMAIDPNTVAIAIVAVVDCNDKSVGGATVSVKDKVTGDPAGTIIYISSTFGNLDPNATMTDSVTGAAFVVGLTDGETVTLDANLSGVTFQHNDIKVTQGAVTLAEVSP